MANTRFNYDPCRTKKKLQQSTDPGKWILNVPGNGDNPPFIEDRQIILQKWGANLRTNTINLESSLKGVNRVLNRDCYGLNNFQNFDVNNNSINYPNNNILSCDQSRATHPAWLYRDLEQPLWSYLPIDPQINTCLPFQCNLNTRILEKDYFTPKRDCIINELNNNLPMSYSIIR